jgi:hypothetical protein
MHGIIQQKFGYFKLSLTSVSPFLVLICFDRPLQFYHQTIGAYETRAVQNLIKCYILNPADAITYCFINQLRSPEFGTNQYIQGLEALAASPFGFVRYSPAKKWLAKKSTA